ncbi:MAG: hypothetical protein Unbinned6284contig1001_56 [Prokaryotic dsDNA virus sp.]|nr:MAG: hypothetical protein Unbinned6284contig1001_56 [Prokaryotic dsDNA virus sp.]|tara:strand:+ start:1509 stop:1727 length:219 start_codon:yes stop_codon:yes gene_type:complete
MSDLLDIDKINNLGPIMAKINGSIYDLEAVCVETGLCRIDVCGMLDRIEWHTIDKILDWDLNEYEPDDFYLE